MTDPTAPLQTVEEPGDAELISAVRAGDLEAYGTLFERHVEAARRLARQLVSAGDVDDLVSESFAKVLAVLQKGGGPDLAFRAYLLTSLRRLHVDKIRAGSRLTTTDDLTPYDPGVPFEDTAVAGFDNQAAAKAFAQLPERWQQVLWHTEVEGQKPAEIAPLLGMSPNSVSALAYRAREGLRQAFISMHAQDAVDDACARTRANLGAYIRNGLSKRDAAKVEEHLKGCRPCTAIYLELTEVNSNLGALLAPLLLGSAGVGYLAAATGGAKVGLLLFLGRARDWLIHNPVGRVTAGASGVAAAAVVVAAVAVSGGNAPKPAAEPPAAPPSSATASSQPPSATTPPASTPKPKPKPKPKPSPKSATTPPATTPSPTTAPPVVPPPSSTPSNPPATSSEQAPVIDTPLPAVTVTPGKSVVINLTKGATDPNGDQLRVKSARAKKPSHGTVVKGGKAGRPVMPRLAGGKTAVSGGAFVLARSSGPVTTVTYTPDEGWRGTDTILYTLSDGHGGTVSGSVRVRTPNTPPIADNYMVPVHGVLSPVKPTLLWPLRHASDSNRDALMLAGFTQPKRGHITPNGDGSLTYTGAPGVEGYTTRFTYTVKDGHGGRDTGTITLKVRADQAPIAKDTSAWTVVTAPSKTNGDDVDVVPGSVELGASDPDGDRLTATFSDPKYGRILPTSDGDPLTWIYQPYVTTTSAVIDSFMYTVTDPSGRSASATVTVHVDPRLQEPEVLPETGYEHVRADVVGWPQEGQSSGAVSVQLKGADGWSGVAHVACGKDLPDPPPSTAQRCTLNSPSTSAVHVDFTYDPAEGWSFRTTFTYGGHIQMVKTRHGATAAGPTSKTQGAATGYVRWLDPRLPRPEPAR
ncbi:sigma-70 family RNA polymerase sigma factor [Nocardioides sp. KR10-350]|uniref:sigma-70 family RNA polymerase sigma factor n=1 Tax=Nocardioides cheoyonin TaxID=3156615 RepID=UPI0032B3B31C